MLSLIIHGVDKIGKRMTVTYVPDTDYNTMVKNKYNTLGLHKVMAKRHIKKTQLVVAPCDII